MNRKLLEAEVLDNMEVAPGIFHMTLCVEETAVSEAVPGQFLNIYPEPGGRMVLPRPFGICGADPGNRTLEIIYEVVGAGTAWMSGMGHGDTLRIGAPLGRGFDLSALEELHAQDPRPFILVGGGVGCGPMLFLARTMKREGLPFIAVLGFRDMPFMEADFKENGSKVLLASEQRHDGCFQGNVIGCMEENRISAPAYFACGPRGMLSAVDEYVSADCGDELLQVSLEERMGCGYGVCVGCSIPVREEKRDGQKQRTRRKVCKDGPVFKGSEVIWHDGT